LLLSNPQTETEFQAGLIRQLIVFFSFLSPSNIKILPVIALLSYRWLLHVLLLPCRDN